MHRPLNLAYFFNGTMRKEEVASGIVAMLFDARRDFREALFQRAGWKDAAELAEHNWQTAVEVALPAAGRIDLRMECDSAVCLVENKVRSGAKQEDQLLRYYLAELAQDHGKAILTIYLAPGEMGLDEVERVAQNLQFQARSQDRAAQVSWQQLAQFGTDLPSADRDHGLVTSGFKRLIEVIEDDKLTKYPAEGVRALVLEIASIARDRLQSLHLEIPLRSWRLPNGEQILTSKCNVTVWLDVTFEEGDDPEHVGLGVVDGDRLRLKIVTKFKLAGKVPKSSELGLRWKGLMAQRHFEVPNRGMHQVQPDGWFSQSTDVQGTVDEAADAAVSAGDAVLRALSPYL